MPLKRKDSNNRVLREGESERTDGRYQYRYTDAQGRHTVYARDLRTLRQKEDEIKADKRDGIIHSEGNMKIIDLVRRSYALMGNCTVNSRRTYEYAIAVIEKCNYSKLAVKELRKSDAQMWMKELEASGKGYGTLELIHYLLHHAFEVARDDDIVRKNPFTFTLSKIVTNNTVCRNALTKEQQEIWMEFIRNDSFFGAYYDEYVVLLGTGLRVSEFCGLTKSDLDFDNCQIHVNHQLLVDKHAALYVQKPKSKAGIRCIPMTAEVYRSLKRILEQRKEPKVERLINGVGGFILLNCLGRPKTSANIENSMRSANAKFHRLHPDIIMPNVTPHVLRHTFCTNMANAGLSPRTLQYLMGHSRIEITLGVYAHSDAMTADEQMGAFLEMASALPQRSEKMSDQ